MSKSDWRAHIAIGGIAAFALWAISLALYLPESPWSVEKYRQQKLTHAIYPKEEDAAREARQWLKEVLENGRPKIVGKKADDPDKSTEQYTTALDLSAQWATAISTADVAALTRLQIFFGVFGLVGLAYTVYYARKTASASIKATEAAIRSADAANDSVRIARESAERQLRAYLSMTPMGIGGFSDGKIVSIEFMPQNHGQTPAYEVQHVFGIEIFPNPLPSGFTLPAATHEITTLFSVFPGTKNNRTWFNRKAAITQKEIDLIRTDAKRLYCWGVTHYVDAFKEKRYVQFSIWTSGENFVKCQELAQSESAETKPKWMWQYNEGHGRAN